MSLFLDPARKNEWKEKHAQNYHGSYMDILSRNKDVWNMIFDNKQAKMINLFHAVAKGKIIADIGAGGGWFGLEAIRKGAEKVYLFEVDPLILEHLEKSFKELQVPIDKYQTVCVDINFSSMKNLPKFDLVYSMAVFMHLYFWQVQSWVKWTAKNLKVGGEAHFQFYQTCGTTMFFNGLDDRPTGDVEAMLVNAGLQIKSKILAENNYEELLPVWYLYHCVKI